MTISVFRTPIEYAKHITMLEEESSETLVASSYLASHLFSKSAVLRYFGREIETNQEVKNIANNLWKRRKLLHSNLRGARYSETYEIDAFNEFCNSGIVHRQAPNFRATPNEVKSVLQVMLDLLQRFSNYHVAFCREVLPFVFIVKVNQTLTIDVRNNFGYQRIQGLLISEQTIVSEFEKEFYRIWREPSTISERDKVLNLIREKLFQVTDSLHLIKE